MEFLDYLEKLARKAYSIRKTDEENFNDIMWYLWCSYESPLFGKDKAATFERYFLEEKELHKEHKNPYYSLYIENAN